MANTLEKKSLEVSTTKNTNYYILVRKSDGLWHIYSKRTNEYLGAADKLSMAQQFCRDYASSYGRVTGMNMRNMSTSSGPCYVTTTCVEILGLDDDGPELSALRMFREEGLRATPAGRSLLAIYDEAGPALVSAINSSPQRREEAHRFYEDAVIPAVKAVQNQDFRTALDCYVAGMRDSLSRHGITTFDDRWSDVDTERERMV